MGISLSDGISTSLLEAMSAGAFPIQTSTACADEWVVDGQTGVLITTLAREPIASAIALALDADELVDTAHQLNMIKIIEKAAPGLLVRQARSFYALGSRN